MHAPDETKAILAAPAEETRLAVLQRFKADDIHSLEREDLLVAQMLAGHGDVWGRWQTPKALYPGRLSKKGRDIDLTRRLRDYLKKEGITTSVDRLMEEGVLALTRLALLMRLAPTGGTTTTKNRRLKPSSLGGVLYLYLPKITARALRRKLYAPETTRLFGCLTNADLEEFGAYQYTRTQLRRLDTLVARGLWHDPPPLPEVQRTTNPAQKAAARPPKAKSQPYPPLPDDWLAEIGPRVLWVVQEMGPNLVCLLEELSAADTNIDWSLSAASIADRIKSHVAIHLERNPWLDVTGRLLTPPFRLITAGGKGGSDTHEWPPRTWEHIVNLSVILQAANLFITLLACAGRIGEVATLTRDCVTVAGDGKDYVNGYTYKLSDSLFGDARQWPAPAILCQCLGQQARLAATWDRLPNKLEDGLSESPRFGTALWVSIGASGRIGEQAEVHFAHAIRYLAIRLDMIPRPGGKLVHPHRFRKTIGRLAGVALFNSPLVLKRLFGHKNIEMTLHYILCDPGVREEAEKVLRELRIMHCAEALEEVHQALRDGLPLPGNGGPGAARLVTTVLNTEQQLNQSGRTWTEGSAYDLACLLTIQGQGWRLVQENIVCSKAPGEDGLCQKKRSKGEPNTANCQPECGNRIVFARRRRDCEQIIEGYLDLARQARDDGQLLVLSSLMDNLRGELANFADLNERYLADPEVRSLLALVVEPEETEVAA